jgi:hypothetical protein
MKYVIEMGSYAMIYIPSFIKTCSGIQKLIRQDTQIHRQHDHLTSLCLFLLNKESGLKIQYYSFTHVCVCESTCLMANNVSNEGKSLTSRLLDGIMFHSEKCSSCSGVCSWFVSSWQQSFSSSSHLYPVQLMSSVVYHGAVNFRVTFTSVQHLCKIQICWKVLAKNIT